MVTWALSAPAFVVESRVRLEKCLPIGQQLRTLLTYEEGPWAQYFSWFPHRTLQGDTGLDVPKKWQPTDRLCTG